jgi:uncharacterized protein (TIGR03545 family)
MNRYIRWWGLIVFVVVIGGAFGSVLLWADWAVKRAVESWGSSMNGARVDLDTAQMTFSPFGFALGNLQVTDAARPMQNAVQVAQIRFALDGYALLRRKFVITDMTMEGVRTNTARAVSGALPVPPPEPEPEPEPESDASSFAFPAMDIPTAGELVASEGLQSGKLADGFRDDIEKAREQWAQRLEQLPGEAKLADYEQRLNAARPALDGRTLQDVQEIARAIKEIEKIRDDVRADVEQVQSVKRALGADLGALSERTKAVLAAPAEDFNRLKGKYSLDAKGLANASAVLFGPQVATWLRTGKEWYGKAEPFLARRAEPAQEVERERLKGVDVRFTDRFQVPDFLIRNVKVSVDVTAGKMAGQIRNVTTDQATLGHPMTFSFFGEEMHGLKDLEIAGTFNHVNPRASIDQMNLKAHGIAIDDYKLIGGRSFPLRLKDSAVDLDTRIELQGGERIASELNVAFKTANFVADAGGARGELGEVVARALADVKSFSATARLGGTLRKYDVDLRSDLDELLRAALNKQFRARIDQLLADARAQLEARVQEVMKRVQARLDEFKAYEQKIEQRHRQFEEKLQKAEAELKAAVDKQKAEAERKRDEAKQQLKSEADEQKQKAKEKAKEKSEKLLKGIK